MILNDLFIVISVFFVGVSSQNVLLCSDILAYKTVGQQRYGVIQYKPAGQLKYVFMRASFQVREKINNGYVGQLDVLGSKESALLRMLRGQTLEYRVDFPSTSRLPWLVNATVNGQLLCTGAVDNSGASESYTLEHLLFDKGDADVLSPLIVNTVNQPGSNNPRPSQLSIPSRPDELNDCGVVSGGNQRIELVYHGTEVAPGDWPWLVAIYTYVRDENSVKFTCGGTLVSNEHVITAGHCMNIRGQAKALTDMILKVGAYNLDHQYDSRASVHSLKAATPHFNYNSHSLKNDLLILTLDRPVVFTQFIRPVCLWAGHTQLEFVIGKYGSVVGWGLNEQNEPGKGPPRMATMPIVSTEICRSSDIGFHHITSNTTLCAGHRNGTGPCNGDSGSGLYILDSTGRWRLRGIVSISLRAKTGEAICNLQEYIVFTDVAKYMPWVQQQIEGISRPQIPQAPTTPPSVEEDGCGVVSGGNIRVDLLYRGSSIAHGDFPWLVAMFRRQADSTKFICAASLVTKQHAISVAHCIQSKNAKISPVNLEAKLGVYKLHEYSESEVIRQISQAVIHPNYDPNTLTNNIMVLKLQRPVLFTAFIRPICLWQESVDQNLVFGKRGTVVGWGITEGDSNVGEPHTASMPIVSRETCIASNPDFSRITHAVTTLCAGDRNGTGPCLGDSGGGMYLLTGGRWRLRGLISLSLRPSTAGTVCNLNEYVVFTDVAQYLPWVQQQLSV